MKKVFATLCLVGSTLALSACDTTGTTTNSEANAPYAQGRTASYEDSAATEVAPAEEVFQKAQKK